MPAMAPNGVEKTNKYCCRHGVPQQVTHAEPSSASSSAGAGLMQTSTCKVLPGAGISVAWAWPILGWRKCSTILWACSCTICASLVTRLFGRPTGGALSRPSCPTCPPSACPGYLAIHPSSVPSQSQQEQHCGKEEPNEGAGRSNSSRVTRHALQHPGEHLAWLI